MRQSIFRPERAFGVCSGTWLFLLTLAFSASIAQTSEPYLDQARELHQTMFSLDAHTDIPPGFATPDADPGQETPGKIDLPKMDRGGLTGAVFAVFVPQIKRTSDNYRQAHEQGMIMLNAIRRMAEQYPDQIGVATSPAEIVQLQEQGRHVAVIGMLNGFPLGPRAQHLDYYYQRGLRQLAFTHAGNNNLADSSRPREKFGDVGPEHGGLSGLGKSVIARLNELGIIVDVSQLTRAGVRQAVALSKTPVVASHSAINALVEHPRNLTDEEMKLIAKSGGVVCIVAFRGYLVDLGFDFGEEMEKIQARFGITEDRSPDQLPPEDSKAYQIAVVTLVRRLPPVTVADYINAIDYAVKLLGVDHVGISTDFNHGGGLVDWKDASDSYRVSAELLRRGYSPEDVSKIWGGNWLRVFSAVTDYAQQIEQPLPAGSLD